MEGNQISQMLFVLYLEFKVVASDVMTLKMSFIDKRISEEKISKIRKKPKDLAGSF